MRQVDETIFTLVFLALRNILQDLDEGYFYYDVEETPLFTLDEVMIAIEDDRWPVDTNDG